MSESDFEKHWLAKFSDCLDRTVGPEIREKILPGGGRISSSAGQTEIIEWTRKAMDRLDALVDDEKRIRIMTGCACRYPESELDEIKNVYANTKDVDIAHKMLQDKFVSFLKDSLKLSHKLVDEVISRGWGLAGIRQGNKIIATKIPKSGNLIEYMEEKDPEKRRKLYCHCPRIRESIGSGTGISPTYCYCGAGFYKAIWEYILQQPVKVELLKSVLRGDDVCTVAIHLPIAE
jgi:predicted hydrocarbon binding protein